MMRKKSSRKRSGPASTSERLVHQGSRQDRQSRHRGLSERARLVWVMVGLVAAIFVAYAPLLGNGGEFTCMDDGEYVVNNPMVHAGLTTTSIAWAFTTFDAGNWHPLTWLSLQVDYELHGLSPAGFRLTNIVLHALSTILLLRFLVRWTGEFWPSAMVAGLFGLHPLHVESVAWIAERKDVLSTLMWIVTMGAYGWYAVQPSVRRYLVVVGCFALGLMAKPMLVTLPMTLLLLDYWPLRRMGLGATDSGTASPPTARGSSLGRLILEKVPLLALSAAACVVTMIAQGVSRNPFLEQQPWPNRVLNAMLSYVRYLLKTIWPADLAPMYSQPLEQFPVWLGVASAGAVVLVTIGCLAWGRSKPYLPVGWLWYLGTLVPVIGLVQVGHQIMADRYTYVPHIGLMILLVWGVRDALAGRCSPRLLAAGGAVFIAVCFAMTIFQAQLWLNSVTLLKHTVSVTRNNFVGHDIYGIALTAKGKVAEAQAQFRQAVELEPKYAPGHLHLGMALEAQQQWAAAAESFGRAAHLAPALTEAQQGLGWCHMKLHQMQEALDPLAKVVQAEPASAVAHGNYCRALLYLGRLEEAGREGEEALRLDPRLHEAKNLLGYVRALQNRPAEAEQLFRSAAQVEGSTRGGDASASYYLAWALQAQGKGEAAREQYRLAGQQFPRWPAAQREEAWRLATHQDARRRNGALGLLRAQVVSQASGETDASALEAVAAAQAELGMYAEAVATQRRAVELAGTADPELREEMGKRLAGYERGQAYRERSKELK